MARKRGRPPKHSSPATASNQKLSDDSNGTKGESIPIDFSLLDDLNVDNLSPKKQEEVLALLDELKNRIKGKDQGTENDLETLQGNEERGPVGADTNPKISDTVHQSKDQSKEIRNNICRKLHLLRKPLSVLNRCHFSDIDKRELDLREKLDNIQHEFIQRPLDTELHIA
ncbi:hypothetical protein RIF29_04239 [Crotalaria pallida]|uniref:Uncharacterized protein n=1 Tax=Crotalaria pallida TaxID=3830 RepID=A0AAN9P965_CROPI